MKMDNFIYEWKDVRERFSDGLLLGNGSSISVHSGFSYKSLFEESKRLGFLSQDAEQVFRRFGVDDFEVVLRHLWHSKLVFDALGLSGEPVDRVNAAYLSVRTALIRTVRETHVSYDDALPHLENIYKFLRGFKTVLSLNYDLILYWAAQYGAGKIGSNYHFKDCFNGDRRFEEKWKTRRDPYNGVLNPTLYFYLHGNLALIREENGNERKVVVGQDGQLLDNIIGLWESGRFSPLFICEGLSEIKKLAINRSSYLSIVNRDVVPDVGDSLVIYGWGIAEQDQHIISRIKNSKIKRIAISIRHKNKELMYRAGHIFSECQCELIYFNSDSSGVWNHA